MVVVRTMAEQDVAQVACLEVESFSDPWSEQGILDSLHQTFSLCLVAEVDDQIAGYLLFYQNLDEGEILRIAVKHQKQRLGIGSLIIEKMNAFCEEKRIKRVMLDVRESNCRAREFYKKQGFVQDGMRKHFYTNPDENAILMSRRF